MAPRAPRRAAASAARIAPCENPARTMRLSSNLWRAKAHRAKRRAASNRDVRCGASDIVGAALAQPIVADVVAAGALSPERPFRRLRDDDEGAGERSHEVGGPTVSGARRCSIVEAMEHHNDELRRPPGAECEDSAHPC
eukprot:CAMPEP_0176123912 /NCGR_PEP_ID=MMETSP0120_2-20121206/62458_1 /TAXON_ID=160619 /ORGANISM="Kryptoperidinium foliaceum, Strain CCMP 1326" /LENGTH=138 /DNA_ID=CAMNT_0017458649 /DNA_START=287 /DNA_END=701 /DNA_ORIENTATION=+